MDDFRCAYFTSRYEDTLAFYRDALGLTATEHWDRDTDDRGTLFGAGGGTIEVLARPDSARTDQPWDTRQPQGIMMVLEVSDAAAAYERAAAQGAEVCEALKDQPWGHRSFVVADPNGVRLYIYSRQST